MYNFNKKTAFLFVLVLIFNFLCINLALADDNELFKVPFIDTILNNSVPTNENIVSKDFQNKSIRVLLSNNGAFEHKEVNLTSDDEMFITSGNKLVTNTTSPVTINVLGDYFVIRTQGAIDKVLVNEPLFISTKSSNIELSNFKKAGKVASYKGIIEVSLSKNQQLKVINILDIEDYIKGVVPNEMPVYFGLEALKAQAISARGYAYRDAVMKPIGYDVCDTTGSQVYYGAKSYSDVSNKAVDETVGQFALYDGKVILSLYSSTSGGHTENYENVFSQNGIDIKFPASPIPYLKGVADFGEDKDLSSEKNAQEYYLNKPNSFEINSPKYRWEYSWTKQDLENILIKNLMKFSNNKFVRPSLKNSDDFGELISIDIPKRGVSGKAMYARITTTKGVFLLAKEITIRQVFTYNNQWLPSANIFFESVYDGKKLTGFKVYGGGFGHGVGLSQYGASGMAKQGYTYDKILKHYYTGISIGSYPVECNLKNMKNCRATFYSVNKHANLILKYSQKPQDLTFKINNNDVLISSESLDKQGAEINIKKWIKKGINTIELTSYNTNILDFSKPSLTFYVELEGKDEK